MKALPIFIAIAALLSNAAQAFEFPLEENAQSTSQASPRWSGFYAGLNLGYGFGTNSNVQSVSYGSPARVSMYTPGPLPDPINFFIWTFPGITQPGVSSINTGISSALSGNSYQNQNGVIGGAQFGYNYELGSKFVVGLEADIQGTGISGNSTATGIGRTFYSSGLQGTYTTPPLRPLTNTPSSAEFSQYINQQFGSYGITNVNAGVNWMGTVRGRVGYLVVPTLMTYVTGGLTYGGAYANVTNYAVENGYGVGSASARALEGSDEFAELLYNFFTGSPTFNFSGTPRSTMGYIGGGSKSQTMVGYNIGGGIEWMFMPNWSLKAEGIYWNMGSINVPTYSYAAPANASGDGLWGSTNAVVVGNTRVNIEGIIARGGINYHFSWGS